MNVKNSDLTRYLVRTEPMQRSLPSGHARTTVTGRNSASKNKNRAIVERQTAVSAYVFDISAELARMAGEAELPMLAYFLNLARVEANMSRRSKEND